MPVQSTASPGADAEITALVNELGPRIYALALRLCGNRADAEDLVQDVFLQAHRKWSTFERRSAPGTWLYTIAVRACRKRLRQRKVRQMPALSEITPFADGNIADLKGSEPLDGELKRETIASLERQISHLPPEFRLPLVLKDVLELPIADVAAILDLKPQTVKTRVHRARMMLRKGLLKKLPSRPAPAPVYERQLCADLLRAKLEAMDKGRRFPLGQEVVCERCRAVFAEFDLGQDLCADLAGADLPQPLRARLLALLDEDPPPRPTRTRQPTA
jgi:RNA polymerase sigma-70 factor, ECF subfamily